MATTKRYVFEVTESKKGTTLVRTNDGFSIYELLGLLEMAKNDLHEQIKNDTEKNIDVVKRQYVEQDKNKKTNEEVK